MLPSAGKSVEYEFLGETATDMQSHANTESAEYMTSTTICTRIVSG